MKKITTLLLGLLAVFCSGSLLAQVNQIDLPVTFDSSNVIYTVTDFGGNATVLGADPANAANTVAITTKGTGAQTWAGTTIGTNLGFATVIPFTVSNRKMTIRVYSPDANIPVRLKVEVHGVPGQSVETEALTTQVNTWETLTFDFNNQATGTAAFNASFPYDMASIFFNFGTDGATAGQKTYYFDDVQMFPSAPAQIDLPVTFDAANTDYTVTDFGGNSTVLGADPANAANTVAITTKGTGAQTWAGTTIGTNLGFANVIPFTASNRKMTVRVYSPDANIPVRLKVEVHGVPGQSVETEALTTQVNTWETLTFDFNNQATGTAAFNASFPYDMASIFFNFGTDGATAGQKTYNFDDVQMFPSAPAQIDLPVTFDAANTDYTVTDFGGTSTVLGADPANAANTVAITTKGTAAQTWAGTTIGTNLGFASVIPFTVSNRKMTIRVYSPDANIPVRLKVEVHGVPGQSVETEALTTQVNTWETLTFDFNNQATGTAAFDASYPYDMASIFFNFGTDGATAGQKTYYFDDVQMFPSAPAQIDLPVTFDVANTDYTVTDFGGTATVLGADPANAANTVAITTKTNTAQTWAGTTIGTNLGFATVIPFTVSNRKMTIRVYSPDANIPVRLKVEVHGVPGQSVETEALTTQVNTWETLTFDFNNQATGTAAFDASYPYDMASIFFNFGTDGATAGQKTYYFDDVQMFPSGPAQIDLPVTFDVANTDYTVTDFGGTATVLGADPANAANTVAITTKTNTAQTWAGTTIGTNLGFAHVIPFTASNRKMTIRVYSPDANIPVRLKAEVHGVPGQSVETEALTTQVNTWETLTFDFNNQATGTAAFDASYPYDMASIFFNFGTDGATAGQKTYYFDDVKMDSVTAAASQITLPITFDDTTIAYTMTDFDGGATTLMANPFSTGINTTPKVLQMIKNAGQVWAGSKLTLATPIDFTTNHVFKMKVYSPRTNCPVLFKLEGPGGVNTQLSTSTTVANDWEELSWDFTGATSNIYTDLVFIYDLGVMGDGSANFTFYQDEITFVPGGSSLNQINLPVTFDSSNVNYTVTDFGGNTTVLGADPVNAANTVAITTKSNTAQTWAGTTIGTNLGFANVIPFTSLNRKMQVRVYSPDAGIPVRLKAEVHGQPTQSVETEALTTQVNTWEWLTFDFNNQATGTAAFNAAYAYDMASIFFNFGTDGATAGQKTYYFDDVRMYTNVGINDISGTSMSIYPNPVASTLFVNLPSTFATQNLKYTILDVTGRIVLAGTLQQNQINTNILSTGMYSMQIFTADGMITKHFVKE
jgi:hypothetical protein